MNSIFKKNLILLSFSFLLISCNDKKMEKCYEDYIFLYEGVEVKIPKINENTKTWMRNEMHTLMQFDYNMNEGYEIIKEILNCKTDYYKYNYADGYIGNWIGYYNNEQDMFRFYIRDFLGSSKYYEDCYIYFIEGSIVNTNQKVMGTFKDEELYNKFIDYFNKASKTSYNKIRDNYESNPFKNIHYLH